jgi:hypothetical protein
LDSSIASPELAILEKKVVLYQGVTCCSQVYRKAYPDWGAGDTPILIYDFDLFSNASSR